MKTSKIFKEALKFLWDGIEPKSKTKGKYVCGCVEHVKHKYIINVDYQIKIINKLLNDHYTLETWLFHEHLISPTLDNPSQIQATRKAWLEHLINHYESIGD